MPSRSLYLIISYNSSTQINLLVNLFAAGESHPLLLIHQDPRYPLDSETLEGCKKYGVRFIANPIAIIWAHFSWIEAVLLSLKYAISLRIEFNWIHILSGNDVPIRPLEELESFLSCHDFDAYINIFKGSHPENLPSGLLGWESEMALLRYYYRYMSWNVPLHRYFRSIFFRMDRFLLRPFKLVRLILVKDGIKVGLRRVNHPFKNGFDCYAGSNWFSLSARAIAACFVFLDRNPLYLRHYAGTHCPEESFFHSILGNQSDLKICQDSLRFIVWRAPGVPSPESLGVAVLKQSSGDSFFARKVDLTNDPELIRYLLHRLTNARPVHKDKISGSK